MESFSDFIKKALVKNKRAKFIYINNFEVEQHWASSEIINLPKITIGTSKATVNRLEEMGVLLASPSDIVILKSPVNKEFLNYLNYQLDLPEIINVDNSDPNLNITQDILNCDKTIQKLLDLKRNYKELYLMPFGTSKYEEKLSKLTGIPLAVPNSTIYRTVNSKVYSRKLNQRLGIKQIPGGECEDIETLSGTFESLKYLLIKGEKLVLKESMGVSGKGIVIIDSESKFYNIMKMIQRKRRPNNHTNNSKVSFVLEKWIEKISDINYQIVIDSEGNINYYGSKEILVKNGVHKGHLIPSSLTPEQNQVLCEVGNKIGKELYIEGYYGIVGIDAILDENNQLWPNLEINARLNMSTYQMRIQNELIKEGNSALAKHYDMQLNTQIDFNEISNVLKEFLFTSEKGEGFLINNFATVNSGYTICGKNFKGRLYGILISNDIEALTLLDEMIQRSLKKIKLRGEDYAI